MFKGESSILNFMRQNKILKNGKIFRSSVLCLPILFLGLFLGACADHSKPTFEYMPNMTDSPAVKAQEQSMRAPVEGTVFREEIERYPYTKEQGDIAGNALQNPLPKTKEVFLRGQQKFNTYCIVCHGPKGQGDGSVVPKFPRPPSLLSDKIRGWTDGRIYHVITTGQNLMPSYASQVLPEDRWAIVYYVRAIQRATKPTSEDIDALKKEIGEGKLP